MKKGGKQNQKRTRSPAFTGGAKTIRRRTTQTRGRKKKISCRQTANKSRAFPNIILFRRSLVKPHSNKLCKRLS